MRIKLKRSLAILLVFVMVISMLPVAFASKMMDRFVNDWTEEASIPRFYTPDEPFNTDIFPGTYISKDNGYPVYCVQLDLDRPGMAPIEYTPSTGLNSYEYSGTSFNEGAEIIYRLGYPGVTKYSNYTEDDLRYATGMAMHMWAQECGVPYAASIDIAEIEAYPGYDNLLSWATGLVDKAKSGYSFADAKITWDEPVRLMANQGGDYEAVITTTGMDMDSIEVEISSDKVNWRIDGKKIILTVEAADIEEFVNASITVEGDTLLTVSNANIDIFVWGSDSSTYQHMVGGDVSPGHIEEQVELWEPLLPATLTFYKKDIATEEALIGCTFSLYKDSACTQPVYLTGANGVYEYAESGDDTFTTDAQGKSVISKLPRATYYIKEIEAVSGYDLNMTAVSVDLYEYRTNSATMYNRIVGEIEFYKKDIATEEALQGCTFSLYKDAACTQPVYLTGANGVYEYAESGDDTFTTDAQGKAVISKLPRTTYYIKEIEAVSGYDLNKTAVMVDLYEYSTNSATMYNRIVGEIEFYKKDIATEGAVLGCTFSLYKDVACTQPVYLKGANGVYEYAESGDDTFTTDAQGKAVISKLPRTTYYIKEVGTAGGYALNETAVTVNLYEYSSNSATMYNAIAGDIGFSKRYKYNESAAGYMFELYRDPEFTDIVTFSNTKTYAYYSATGSITTIKVPELIGVTFAGLPAGTYYVKWLTTPIEGELRTHGDGIVVSTGGVYPKLGAYIYKEDPILDCTFSLYKDAECTQLVYLTGSDGVYQSGGTGETFTTDSQGNAVISGVGPGTYYIKEKTPALGYKLNTVPSSISVNSGEQATVTMYNEKKIDWSMNFEKRGIVDEWGSVSWIEGCTFSLYKDSRCRPEDIVYLKNHPKYAGSYLASEAPHYELYTTGLTEFTAGYISIDNLPTGTYYIKELTAPSGSGWGYIVNQEPLEVTVVEGEWSEYSMYNDSWGIENTARTTLVLEKQDAATGYLIDGCYFRLYDDYGRVVYLREDSPGNYTANAGGEYQFTTRNGRAYISGLYAATYYVEEVSAAPGYEAYEGEVTLYLEEGYNEIYLYNYPIDYPSLPGDLSFAKYSSLGGYLYDCTFSLYKDERCRPEDIVYLEKRGTSNGSYYGGEGYSEGKFLTPDSEGNIVTEFKTVDYYNWNRGSAGIWALPPGTYWVKEVSTVEGYELNTTPVKVVIDGKKSFTSYASMTNQASGKIKLHKKELGKDIPVTDSTFSLYSDEACTQLVGVTGSNGDYTARTNGGGTFTTNAQGEAMISGLEFKTYWVKEVSATEGYLLNTVPERADVKSDKWVEVTLYNKKRDGINFFKRETGTDKPVTGCTFSLYSDEACTQLIKVSGAKGNYRADDNGEITFTTDDNGEAVISNLLPGDYWIKEITAASGFFVQTDAVKGTIVDEQIEMTMYNRRITGHIAVSKYTTDKDDSKIMLKDIYFDIYAYDKDGILGDTPIATLVTGEDGYAITGELPAGRYKVVERDSKGYIKSEPFDMLINQKDSVYTYSVYNEKVTEEVVKRSGGGGSSVPKQEPEPEPNIEPEPDVEPIPEPNPDPIEEPEMPAIVEEPDDIQLVADVRAIEQAKTGVDNLIGIYYNIVLCSAAVLTIARKRKKI